MPDVTAWLRTGALVVLAAGLVPVALHHAAALKEQCAREATAEALAAFGRQALAAGDPALAGQAAADAVAALDTPGTHRTDLITAHVESVLQDAAAVNGGNALRLHVELGTAVAAPATPTPRLLLALGRVLLFRGQPEEAQKLAERAVAAAPDLAIAHLHLGDLLLKRQQYAGAAAALEKALALDPKLVEATFALGQTRLAQEQLPEAERLLTDASGKLASGHVFLALARVRLRQEQWTTAAVALERAVALSPELTVAWGLLGEAYARQGLLDLAVPAFEAAWRKGGDAAAWQRAGDLLLQATRYREAATVFDELRKLHPAEPQPHLGLAVAARGLGQKEAAAREAEVALALARRDARFEKVQDQAEQVRASLAGEAVPPAIRPEGR